MKKPNKQRPRKRETGNELTTPCGKCAPRYALLKFRLPDEQWHYDRASKATAAFGVLEQITGQLRTAIKYHDLGEKELEVYIKFRDQLWAIITEENIGDLL